MVLYNEIKNNTELSEEDRQFRLNHLPLFSAAPFIDQNTNPITIMELLFLDESFLALCKFQGYKDIKDWFMHSIKIKSFPKP